MPSSRVTISDIARIAGVSPATVSKVLNGATDVGPETRRKVLRIMDDMDFKPRQGARMVDYIAVDFPTVSGYFARRLLTSILNAALAKGYLLTIAPTDFLHDHLGGIKQFMRRSNIVGFLLRTRHPDDPVLREIVTQEIPHVLVNRRYEIEGAHYVVADTFRGVYNAIQHLIRLNHRRIAFVGNPTRVSAYYADHIEGYRRALEDSGIGVDRQWVLDHLDGLTEDTGRQAVLELWSRDVKPTALITVTEDVANGCIKTLRDLKVRVPEEISLVTLDEISSSSLIEPECTHLVMPTEELGREAVRCLLDQIQAKEPLEPTRIVLPAPLAVRGSTGPAPSDVPVDHCHVPAGHGKSG